MIYVFEILSKLFCSVLYFPDDILNLLGFRNGHSIFVDTSDVRNQSVWELLNNTRTGRRRRDIVPTLFGSTSYFDIVDGKLGKF